MQDLKSKKMFNYEIIVKIELTEKNREYFSFNSEIIQFGYCIINNFKADEITIKNYSTDQVKLNISIEGDVELQSVNNMTINL
jgi:preprotein translocase subunit SecB